MPLENYYSGDKAFKRFASIPDTDLDDRIREWPHWQELVNACHQDNDLARVIFYHCLDYSIDYLDTRVPALDNLTPRECMKSPRTLNRLRQALMRMQ